MIDLTKFDKQTDLEGLQKDIETAEDNDYKEVPLGVYEVALDKIEIIETKKEPVRPMVSIWYKIVDGEYKNSIIFQNQVINEGWQIKSICRFLKEFKLIEGEDIKFESYVQFNDLLLDLHEIADEGKYTFQLNYGENKKGFNTYDIEKVWKNN